MIPALIVGTALIAFVVWLRHSLRRYEFPTSPRCPHCLRQARFRYHEATVDEEHGERFLDVWWTCSLCGERVDEAELIGGVL